VIESLSKWKLAELVQIEENHLSQLYVKGHSPAKFLVKFYKMPTFIDSLISNQGLFVFQVLDGTERAWKLRHMKNSSIIKREKWRKYLRF